MDDLQFVAVLDDHLAERRSGHDLQIALDRDLFRREAQLIGELRQRQPFANAAMLAVDEDLDRPVDAHGLLFHLSL